MAMRALRGLALAGVLAVSSMAAAQQPDTDGGVSDDTVTIRAAAAGDRPTLLSHIAQNELPTTTEALLERLNAPGVCGRQDRPTPDRKWACAIVVYHLVDRDPAQSTPMLVFRAIQHITHPDNRADTALRMVNIDGKIVHYTREELDEPLRPMRVENSCKRVWSTAKQLGKVKRCNNVNARYLPIGILGFGENERLSILTGETKTALFSIALEEK